MMGPKQMIQKSNQTKEVYYTTNTLSKYFNEPPLEIQRWIRQGRFQNVVKATKQYLVPKTSVIEYEAFVEDIKENYLGAEDVTRKLNVSKSTIGNWINNGTFKGSLKWLNKWYIPLSEIDRIQLELREIEELKRAEKEFREKKKYPRKPEDCLTFKEVSKELNIRTQKVAILVRNNELGRPIKCVENGVMVNAVKSGALQRYKEKIKDLKRFVKVKDAANYLGNITPQTVSGYVKEGFFPNALLEKGSYYIPLEDLEEFQKYSDLSVRKKKKDINKENKAPLTKKEMLNNLLNQLNKIDVPNYLTNTKRYYIEYVTV